LQKTEKTIQIEIDVDVDGKTFSLQIIWRQDSECYLKCVKKGCNCKVVVAEQKCSHILVGRREALKKGLHLEGWSAAEKDFIKSPVQS